MATATKERETAVSEPEGKQTAWPVDQFPRIEGVEQLDDVLGPAFSVLRPFDARKDMEAKSRVFLGDGTRLLKCPGLLSLEAVYLSEGQMLPKTLTLTTPLDASCTRHHVEELPVYAAARLADGTPVLMRNELSNNGVWQDDFPVYVVGKWDSVPYDPPKLWTKNPDRGKK